MARDLLERSEHHEHERGAREEGDGDRQHHVHTHEYEVTARVGGACRSEPPMIRRGHGKQNGGDPTELLHCARQAADPG